MSSTSFKIRTVPSVTNPTPRPSTPGRPGTSSGLKNQGFSSGMAVPSTHGSGSFNVFDTEEPSKSVFDDMITEEYLQTIAGTEDLSSVTSIKLVIDTSYQSLLDIGDFLKRLDYLILDGSKICSVRDLGVGLKFLSSLSINDCGLSELDGIGMLTNLKELSARDNDIEDVTALALHETIESIDLHGNKITDISIADTLSSCPNLHHLILAGNSIERAPKYKLVVAAMIPQLQSLDGVSVDGNAKNKVSNGMILEAASAMQLEQEELDDERRMEMEMMGDDMCFGSGSKVNSSDRSGNSSSNGRSEYNSTTGEGCSLPDNGSDLTHGSAVVLAGSMASAIRRRRNGSPRASSSHSQEETTLDSASHVGDSQDHEQYYGEGDITKAMQKQDKSLKMKMASSPKNSQFRQKKKSAPTSLSMDVNTSQSNSVEGSHTTPRSLSNPIAAAIISAAHNQNSISFDYNDNASKTNERHPKSSGVSGTAPAGWASRPLSRNHSRHSNHSSRSPSPNARNNSSAEGRKPPKSPPTWQRNASRPQSTASSGRGTSHGIAGGIGPTPSAPFKVLHPDGENDSESPCPSPLIPHKRPQKTTSASSLVSKEVLPNLSRHPGKESKNKRGSLWDDCSGVEGSVSDSGEDDFRGHNQRRGVGPSTPSGGKKGISNSLVKKDNILRGLLFSDEPEVKESSDKPSGGIVPPPKREAGYSFDYKDEGDDDYEEFATDHKSRHEFMRSEQKERETNKQKQKQMMTFSQVTDDPSRLSLQSSHSQKSTDTDPDIQESSINLSECIQPSANDKDRDSSSGKQLSEVATRSLGFDLKGSLAAINQWVDDQDSEDEEEEEEAPVVSKYGDVWSMRNEMKRATTAQKKILSRDKIIGMCTGNVEDTRDSRSRLTADNLAMNECIGADYSYDQDDDDDDESECEENEVMFYDNNVDKTTNNLSKSCSLLTIGGFGDSEEEMKSKKEKEKEAEQKKLMSMSLQVDKPPKSSPRAKKRTVQRESSKNSVIDDVVVDSRGCTPSSNVHLDAQVCAGVSSKSTIETDVRNSPSDDVRDVAHASRTTKKNITEKKMKIEITKESCGPALALSDEQLVDMLSQPPKAVPTLKTKSGFQDFFRGMHIDRMRLLLEAAYKEMTILERDNKVRKRMDLLGDVLTN